jgi:glucose/arabinose dehydrogenase
MPVSTRVFLPLLFAFAASACDEGVQPSPAATAPSESRGPSHVSSGFELGLDLVASGISSPVNLSEVPDGSGRLVIVDQPGRIWIVAADGTRLPVPFLDISSKLVPLNPNGDERGLLGMAFHPNYAQNGRFYLYYSAPRRSEAPANFNHTSHISEFRVSADPNVADAGSERIVMQVDEPQVNHNAGMLAFGPHDGKLYISLGDGGGRDDENPTGHVSDWYAVNAGGNGQDIEQNLLGSILRIDVDAGVPYGVPADNPFVGKPGLDEIWAYGFRNPFRFSFDMAGDHALLVGDAGQERWEEVSLVTKGGNYGWNVKEGTHCFDAAAVPPFADLPSCPSVVTSGIRAGDPLIDPVIEYANSKQGGLGRTVVGGYVYRGSTVPQLAGRYVFGDYTVDFVAPNGSVFTASPRGTGLWHMQQIQFPSRPGGRLGHFVKGFGQDAAGEVYIMASDTPSPFGTLGKVYRLTKNDEDD